MKNFSIFILLAISICGYANQELLSPFSKFSFSAFVNGESIEVYIESDKHRKSDYPERIYYTPNIVIIKVNGKEIRIPKGDYEKFGGFDIGLISISTEAGNLTYIRFPIGIDPRNNLKFVFQDWEYKGTTTTIYDAVSKDNTREVEWFRD